MSFIVTDIVHHSRIPYRSRVFDEQEGYRFTYAIRNGSIFIETGVYLHWREKKIVDLAFDLSCMSGCAYKCRFCASSTYDKGYLTEGEIIEQVNVSLKYLAIAHEEFLDQCTKYTFSFEGMGEPSLPNVSKNIQKAIIKLQEMFGSSPDKTIQFIISTIGAYPTTIREWADNKLPLETLQVSLHAMSDTKRRRYIGQNIAGIDEIFAALEYFSSKQTTTLIKINYLLLKDEGEVNYTREEIDSLIKYLNNANQKYLLKISHLNDTSASKRHNIVGVWGREAAEWYEYIRKIYPKCYEYGTTSNLGISCGQLASYAEHAETLHQKEIEYIDEIYEEIVERNAILFLGAGVSSVLWNAKQLAEELFNELSIGEEFQSASLDLQQVADIYSSRNKLDKLYNKLRNTIKTKKFPPEFLELTRHPWRAIYTTNYDDFIERAYDAAQKLGFTTQSYSKISKTSDFNKKISPKDVPVIKLHGCIHDELGKQVISTSDYFEIFWEANKQTLLKRFEADVMQHCVIFSGYSLNDPHIAQIIYDINKIKSPVRVKGYLVSPQSNRSWASDLEANLLKKFNIKLVKCRFDDFVGELSRKRRALKVFVSGSIKRTIPGADEKKQDVSAWVAQLCSYIGDKFEKEGIKVRTGATATDKVGYLVAKSMSNRNVKTYVWYGAEGNEYNNEVEEMINKENYGSGPMDVVDRITRECNVVVFIGGSGLALEEVYSAISRNLLVIPVRLIDDAYASNIAYEYFYSNLDAFDRFGSDKSPSAKKRGGLASSKYLTKNRLGRLDMRISTPEDAGEAIVETILHYQMELL